MISIEYRHDSITTIVTERAISRLVANTSQTRAIFINPHFGPNYSESVTEGYVFLASSVRKTSTDALQLVVERCAATSTEGPCGHMLSVFQ